MGLFDQVDQYCERLGAAFWAEPLNAVSNAGFLVAAALIWRRAGRDRHLRVLAGLLAVVGVGSFVFHTVATVWAMAADVAPIVVALLWFLWIYLRRAAGLAPRGVALGFVAFGLASGLFGVAVPKEAVNGSQNYFAVALALGAMGARQKKKQGGTGASAFFVAAAIFVVALVCRSIDMAVCDALPWGTHWLWHLLNAVAFYAAALGLIAALQSRGAIGRASN